MLETRIKKLLDDIIDVTFSDESPLNRNGYKNYHLYIQVKENDSTSGMYTYEGHKIEVYNPSLGARHLAKCCLHELSHHIDYIKHGTSGHQKPFYEIYTKLIYASLDMGVLSVQDFNDMWSSDRNKVRAIVKVYEPHPVEYKVELDDIICVCNGYNKRDILKRRGYSWNKVEQVWEKTFSEDEEKFLLGENIPKVDGKESSSKSICFYVTTPDMHVDAIIYIEATGKTFSCKQVLKDYHFYYDDAKKKWLCKVFSAKKDEFLKELKADTRLYDCYFSVHKRKS